MGNGEVGSEGSVPKGRIPLGLGYWGWFLRHLWELMWGRGWTH